VANYGQGGVHSPLKITCDPSADMDGWRDVQNEEKSPQIP